MITELQQQVRWEYARICGISNEARELEYNKCHSKLEEVPWWEKLYQEELQHALMKRNLNRKKYEDAKELTQMAFRRYNHMRRLLALFQQHKILKQE
jgi:hypothetical protein